MPKKSHPPAPAGTSILHRAFPPVPTPPRSFDPGLAKARKPGLPAKSGAGLRGKSANRLIHAQKSRGR